MLLQVLLCRQIRANERGNREMREILFRGKRVDTKEWVYGYVYPGKNGGLYIVTTHGQESFEIDPETVSQYTGLTDKNGVKIFEGDILKSEQNRIGYIGAVYYEDCQWFGSKDYLGYAVAYSGAKVIGNIHDNPELLEVSQ